MHPRDDLIRARFDDIEPVGDGNTLVGYAAVFDTPTEIHSWEGDFVETLARGAFKRTLAQRAGQIRSQFDHGMSEYTLPIGVPTVLREDDHGLYVGVELDQDPWVQETLKPKLGRSINGMSFRFSVTDDEWSDSGDQRTIRSVKLSEVGPVTFPAYEATTVGVRSRDMYRLWTAQQQFSPAGPAVGTPTPADDSPPPRHLSATDQIRSAMERARIEGII